MLSAAAATIAALIMGTSAAFAGEAPMSHEGRDTSSPAAGLWRVEGVRDRCLISLMQTSSGAGTRGVLVEGCDGHRLAGAARWRMAQGVVELQDEQGRSLARLAIQGPDVMAGPGGLRLTRAPEA